jgi:hypothetical protein
MNQSIGPYLDQVEYVSLTALDLNKPNPLSASGFVQFVDFGGGVNITHFLDPRPCIALSQVWESVFRRRTKAVILVEMPKTFQAPLNLFLQLSKHSTRNKMRFCANPEEAVAELRKLGCDEATLAQFRIYMRERRSSGSQPTWHPIIDLPFFRERLADLKLSQDTAVLTPDFHRRFREVIQEFRIHKWGCPMRPVLDISAEAPSNGAFSQVAQDVAPAVGSTTAISDTKDRSTIQTHATGTVEVNPTLSMSVPTQQRQISSPKDLKPRMALPVEEEKPISKEITPGGGSSKPKVVPSVTPSLPSSDKTKPATIDAKKAPKAADRKGCAAGIARILQRVVCCKDVSSKPQAA